jgi:SSS family solute:Na+ symporter
MIVYAVLEIAIRGVDQQFVQRYLACTDVGSAVKSSWTAMIIGLPATLLFFGLGALLWSWYQLNPGAMADGSINQAFPDFILNQLPVGIKGLLVAALLAASMSSFDSAINALNNTTLVDLMGRKTDDPKSLGLARKISLGWGLLALVAALYVSQNGDSLLKQALYFTSLFTGPLLAMVTLAFMAPNWRPSSVLIGVALGLLSLFVIAPPPFLDWHSPWLSWPWNPVISGGGTVLFGGLCQLIVRK